MEIVAEDVEEAVEASAEVIAEDAVALVGAVCSFLRSS